MAVHTCGVTAGMGITAWMDSNSAASLDARNFKEPETVHNIYIQGIRNTSTGEGGQTIRALMKSNEEESKHMSTLLLSKRI